MPPSMLSGGCALWRLSALQSAHLGTPPKRLQVLGCDRATGKLRDRLVATGTSQDHAVEAEAAAAAAEAQELERRLGASTPLVLRTPKHRSKPLVAAEQHQKMSHQSCGYN